MGRETDDYRTTFNIGSFEAVFAIPTEQGKSESSWRSFQFGIGMNRLRSFNNRQYVEGGVTPFSMLDIWVDDANEYGLDPFTSRLAWERWLIDTLTGGAYINNFSGRSNQLRQSRHEVQSGGINEMAISFSGNYSDKFYMGLTLGVPFLSYYRSSAYREVAENTGDIFDFNENYEANGAGINLKIGAIYRPIEMLRIGLAFHTPTYYDLKEVYETSVSDGNNTTYSGDSEGGYDFCSPMKLIASVAATFGDQNSLVAGSVDFDYEFTNYHGTHISPINDDVTNMAYETWRKSINTNIKDTYNPGHTFRLGGSFNIRHWVLRAGITYYNNPYKEYEGWEHKNLETLSAACGFGYRTKHFFIDFAYAHTVYQDYEYFNTYSTNAINSDYYNNLFMTTIGFKF